MSLHVSTKYNFRYLSWWSLRRLRKFRNHNIYEVNFNMSRSVTNNWAESELDNPKYLNGVRRTFLEIKKKKLLPFTRMKPTGPGFLEGWRSWTISCMLPS